MIMYLKNIFQINRHFSARNEHAIAGVLKYHFEILNVKTFTA